MANLNLVNLAVEAEKLSISPSPQPSSRLSHERCILLPDLALKAEKRSFDNHMEYESNHSECEYLLMSNLAGVAKRYEELAEILTSLPEEREEEGDFGLQRYLADVRRIGVELKPAADDKRYSYNALQDVALAELPPTDPIKVELASDMQEFEETLLPQGTNTGHPSLIK